jgi:hypothetical protein
MDTNSAERLNQRVWLALALLGAFLCVVGWVELLR